MPQTDSDPVKGEGWRRVSAYIDRQKREDWLRKQAKKRIDSRRDQQVEIFDRNWDLH